MGFDINDLLKAQMPGDDQQQDLPPVPLRPDYKPNPVVMESLAKKYPDRVPAAAIKPTEDPVKQLDPGVGAGDEESAKDPQSGMGWLQFAAGLGDAIAGRSSSDTAKNFAGYRKDIEQNDPNSVSSKRFRETLKANYPELAKQYGDQFEKLTAGDQPNILKVAETKAKLQEAHDTHQMAHEDRKLNNEVRRSMLDDKKSEKDNKDFLELDKALGQGWAARGGQAGKVQSVINSAERLNGLFSQFPDGNVPKAQTVELATAVAGLISGGSPQSQHQIDMLVPDSMKGKAQDIAAWVTNDPTGRQQQKFIHLLQDTTNRELQIATAQKHQWQREALAARENLKTRNPDRYNSIIRERMGVDPDSPTVKILTPDGQVGEIPRVNLKEALKRGAKEI